MQQRALLWAVVVGLVLLVGSAAAASTLTATSGQIPFIANSGMEIVLDGTTPTNVADPFVDSETVAVETAAGNATFSSPVAVSARVTPSGLSGSEFRVDQLDLSAGNLTVSGDGFGDVVLSGAASQVDIRRDFAVDDGTVDLSHTNDLTVSLPGLPSSTTVAALDQTGSVVALATTDSAGRATFELPGSNDIEFVSSDGPPQLSNPSPQGDLTEIPSNLTVEFSDPDLSSALTDAVSVEISLNGDVVATRSKTAAGTLTVDLANQQLPAGQNNWTVTATDPFGQTTTAQYGFGVPGTLKIFNESAPTELINNSTVELRFFFENLAGSPDLIETRTASNGSVNMTGLPANEPFVIVAEAPGFAPRRIFVPSLIENQELYLLPNSVGRVNTIFEIEDYSGNFPPDSTVLLVQRELAGPGWSTVVGDFFGANADFPAELATDKRHRLVLLNVATGDRRVLGTYTPITSETETVTVSPEGEFEIIGRGPIVSVSPELSQLPPRDGVEISAGVLPGDDELAGWTAEIVAVNATGAETSLATVSDTAGGTLAQDLNLSGRDGQRVEIRVSWSTDAASGSRTIGYRVEQSPASSDNFLSALGAFEAALPGGDRAGVLGFLSFSITIIGTAAVVSAYQLPTELSGLIALLFLLLFAVLGWIGYDIVFVSAIALFGLAFLRRRY